MGESVGRWPPEPVAKVLQEMEGVVRQVWALDSRAAVRWNDEAELIGAWTTEEYTHFVLPRTLQRKLQICKWTNPDDNDKSKESWWDTPLCGPETVSVACYRPFAEVMSCCFLPSNQAHQLTCAEERNGMHQRLEIEWQQLVDSLAPCDGSIAVSVAQWKMWWLKKVHYPFMRGYGQVLSIIPRCKHRIILYSTHTCIFKVTRSHHPEIGPFPSSVFLKNIPIFPRQCVEVRSSQSGRTSSAASLGRAGPTSQLQRGATFGFRRCLFDTYFGTKGPSKDWYHYIIW